MCVRQEWDCPVTTPTMTCDAALHTSLNPVSTNRSLCGIWGYLSTDEDQPGITGLEIGDGLRIEQGKVSCR